MSVVNSYNIFVDTERNLSQDSTGDNIHLPLGQTPITCGSNEYIRLTLQEFSMLKSWNNVNSTNNVFRVADSNSTVISAITEGNYASARTMLNRGFLGNSASGFLPVAPLKTALETLVNFGGGSKTITQLLLNNPSSSQDTIETSTNIASITATYSTAHGYTTTNLPRLHCYVADGKSYQLLGAKRISDPANTTTSSWIATLGDTTTPTPANTTTQITFRMLYPAQHATETHVYLRVGEQNTNLATSGLSSIDVDTNKTEMVSTKILGIIPIDTQYVRFVASNDMVFFTHILSKQISHLQLQITDSNGNKFPLTDPTQDTLGNRFFNCVIKVDIVSLGSNPQHSVNNPNTQETTAPRFSTGPSTMIGHIQSMGLNGVQSGYYGDGFYDYRGKRVS